MSDEWQKAETVKKEYWKPEKAGDEKVGILLRGETGEYKETGKPTLQYVIKTDAGECYLPNHTVLNSQMVTVKNGQKVKVVYLGTAEKKKKGKAPAELYDVFISNQTTLEDTKKPEIIDTRGKILQHLKKAPAGMQEDVFWDMVTTEIGNMSDSIKTVDRLKTEGKIVFENGTWRAT